MGAWGTGPFENDGAGDWEASLTGISDLSPISEVVAAAGVGVDEYLEVDVGQQVIAAGEAMAVLLGRPHPTTKYPSRVTEWATRCGSVKTGTFPTQLATAIDRVLQENSEYNELWAESEHYQVVLQHATDLKARLLGGKPSKK